MNYKIFILCLIAFFDVAGYSMILPLLPVFIKNFNLNIVEAGFLVSIFSLGNIFGAIILGIFSDKYGHKKSFLLSLLMLCISYFLIGFFQYFSNSFVIFLVLRFINGFFSGSIVITFALTSIFSSDKLLLKNFSLLGMTINLGFVFGPSIGGILSNSYNSINCFFYVCLSYFICMIFLIFFIDIPNSAIITKSDIHIKEFIFNFLKKKRMLLFLYILIIISISFFGIEVFLGGHILSIKFKQTPFFTGIFWSYAGVITAITQLFLIKIFKNSKNSVIIGLLVFAFSTLALILVQQILQLFILITFIAFAYGILSPHVNTELSLSGSKKQQGTVFGISFATNSIGYVLGPYFFSYIYIMSNNITFIWISIFLLLLTTVIFSTIFFKNLTISKLTYSLIQGIVSNTVDKS